MAFPETLTRVNRYIHNQNYKQSVGSYKKIALRVINSIMKIFVYLRNAGYHPIESFQYCAHAIVLFDVPGNTLPLWGGSSLGVSQFACRRSPQLQVSKLLGYPHFRMFPLDPPHFHSKAIQCVPDEFVHSSMFVNSFGNHVCGWLVVIGFPWFQSSCRNLVSCTWFSLIWSPVAHHIFVSDLVEYVVMMTVASQESIMWRGNDRKGDLSALKMYDWQRLQSRLQVHVLILYVILFLCRLLSHLRRLSWHFKVSPTITLTTDSFLGKSGRSVMAHTPNSRFQGYCKSYLWV